MSTNLFGKHLDRNRLKDIVERTIAELPGLAASPHEEPPLVGNGGRDGWPCIDAGNDIVDAKIEPRNHLRHRAVAVVAKPQLAHGTAAPRIDLAKFGHSEGVVVSAGNLGMKQGDMVRTVMQ